MVAPVRVLPNVCLSEAALSTYKYINLLAHRQLSGQAICCAQFSTRIRLRVHAIQIPAITKHLHPSCHGYEKQVVEDMPPQHP